ncbi:hypothetical protein [Campylobacter fetus]|uniref:hypothetical protein n=1 Tax=Campylobacter fetus TaxID=196 RepID=UPI000FCC6AE9|nr:hypothetical protein [Campylobacter fetus]RUT50972.1 hypothetical protein BWK67_00165 [Campylobacter fetus]RUT51700.1 hypothetical protein BWK51_00165 [Campylobacter fetus]
MKINEQETLDIVSNILAWRESNSLNDSLQKLGYSRNIFEELGEYAGAIKDKDTNMIVDALCDILVFSINNLPNKLSVFNAVLTATNNELEKQPNQMITKDIFEESLHFILANTLNAIRENKESNLFAMVIALIIITKQYIEEVLNYNFKDCMDETIKEINSRTGSYNSELKKWVKDSSKEAKAKWYKANYNQCKITTLA